MNVGQQMLGKMSLEEELEKLVALDKECEEFLRKWAAYDYPDASYTGVAMVAIFELQYAALQRKAYIMGLTHVDDLPL